jgi:hypothetical protein
MFFVSAAAIIVVRIGIVRELRHTMVVPVPQKGHFLSLPDHSTTQNYKE